MTPPFSGAGTLNTSLFTFNGGFSPCFCFCPFSGMGFREFSEFEETTGDWCGGIHWTFLVVWTGGNDVSLSWWSRNYGKCVCGEYFEWDGRGSEWWGERKVDIFGRRWYRRMVV